MSSFSYLRKNEEFEIWLFQPDLLHAFPFSIEQVTKSWRIRLAFEYFIGTETYFIKKDNKWAGYCIVTNGRNPRYSFSNAQDIVFGRYFVAKEFRGDGLGYRLLDEVLNKSGILYNNAFAYVKKTNLSSMKTILKLGAEEVYRFDIKGFLRRFHKNDEGEYILFRYRRELP